MKIRDEEATALESLMFASLLTIARSGTCPGCRWDDPCNKCFAANVVHDFIEWPKFKKWKRRWKLTAVRTKKRTCDHAPKSKVLQPPLR